MDFKNKSRPFFIIIFKSKNRNFKTRDFSPLIERVLAGVVAIHLRLESGSFFFFPFMQYAFASDTVSDISHDTSLKLFIQQ